MEFDNSLNFSQLLRIALLKLKLRFSKNKTVVFGLYLGELQFLKNIIELILKEQNELNIIIAHESNATYEEFCRHFEKYKNKVIHISKSLLSRKIFSEKEIDCYISSDGNGINNVTSIYTFHGQPSKGLTFEFGKLNSYDALFLYGPLQKEALEHFINTKLNGQFPEHITTFDVGYSKSDDLVNGKWSREKVLSKLNLPPEKKTILYAPAFNEYASLREYGPEIITKICALKDYNVIVKLPIDCLRPAENQYANGGVDWFSKISEFRIKFENFRLYEENQIDPVLEASDILITCVSSVSFEFLVLNKPVIFIDTPRFFTHYLPKIIPHTDTTDWENLTFINGGKEFGTEVFDLNEIPIAIESALNTYPIQQEEHKKITDRLLFNPGRGAEKSVQIIIQIIDSKSIYKRDKVTFSILETIFNRIPFVNEILAKKF